MAYVILQKNRNGGKWQIATSAIADSQHSAAAKQKNVERANPAMETARIWVELPA